MRAALLLALGIMAATPAAAGADVRIVRFGGELGNRYEPAELTVQAGDVVAWTGDFTAHPLRYRLSPTDPFSPPYTGPSPFRRTLVAAGDRIEYLCAEHGDAGMRGVVTAVARTLTKPPLLSLSTSPSQPIARRPVTINAAYVAGTGDGRYDTFRWDLDGASQQTSQPQVTTTYATGGRKRVAVTATSTINPLVSTSSSIAFVVAASSDITPPDLKVVGLRPSALRDLLDQGLTATIRASEVAQARVDLFDGERLLAGATVRLSSRDTVVRLRVSSRGAAALRGRRDQRLKLRIAARDDAGNRNTLRKTFIAR